MKFHSIICSLEKLTLGYLTVGDFVAIDFLLNDMTKDSAVNHMMSRVSLGRPQWTFSKILGRCNFLLDLKLVLFVLSKWWKSTLIHFRTPRKSFWSRWIWSTIEMDKNGLFQHFQNGSRWSWLLRFNLRWELLKWIKMTFYEWDICSLLRQKNKSGSELML